MKQLFILVLLLISFNVLAQAPAAFKYQTVVRDGSGNIVSNQSVSFRISILEGSETGTPVYVETHSVSTNSFGLANFKIGNGAAESGTFGPTGWGDSPHFVKVEFDPDGGNSFLLLGTTQLLSVPYAFHAQTVENDQVNDADADPVNEIQTLTLSGTELTLSGGGGTVTLPSSGGGDNWGTQTVESDATIAGEGTSSSPLSVDGDLTDDQTLSLSGNDLSISDGNTVTLPAGGSSLWTEDGDDIYFDSGKVGIGTTPSGLRRFQVVGGEEIGIVAENNDDRYGALFAENMGTGPAADFRNHIRILDGTQGPGKVLTSDADGFTSWQEPASAESFWSENGSEIYFEDNVGIGTTDPDNNLDIVNPSSSVRIKSTSTGILYDGDAFLMLDKASNSKNANLNLQSDGDTKFYAGLLGNNDFRISTNLESLNGLEVQSSGDVNVSGELHSEATGPANMIPIAYGVIDTDGSIMTSSGNVSCTRISEGRYEITINGEDYYYSEYVEALTIKSEIGFIRAGSVNDNLLVRTYDENADSIDFRFSFVVYKP